MLLAADAGLDGIDVLYVALDIAVDPKFALDVFDGIDELYVALKAGFGDPKFVFTGEGALPPGEFLGGVPLAGLEGAKEAYDGTCEDGLGELLTVA